MWQSPLIEHQSHPTSYDPTLNLRPTRQLWKSLTSAKGSSVKRLHTEAIPLVANEATSTSTKAAKDKSHRVIKSIKSTASKACDITQIMIWLMPITLITPNSLIITYIKEDEIQPKQNAQIFYSPQQTSTTRLSQIAKENITYFSLQVFYLYIVKQIFQQI